ncbi:cell adhesion molecule Dscam1-like isoform X1 [Tachypleus tridentatus]|uniref:cell adhesion molecule Dscam1-like isoform X1 n=2 Tax=Tachypleus tridentatus TaxID=6853 RepID=UPI003FD2E43B
MKNLLDEQLCIWTSLILIVLVSASTLPKKNKDVVEGEMVRLQCRFNPALSSGNILYYWIRTNKDGKDNAAISGVALDPHYQVEFAPNEGRYDLLISHAKYDADNGHFECKLKEGGSGADIYNMAFTVTVLIPPGPPNIIPTNPTAKEGEPFILTCSSEGGSPDPLIQWYREGTPLQGQLQKGGSRDKPTSSVLKISPKMEDDGATYRCAVWNRAIREEQKLEASVTLKVHFFPRVTVGPYNPLNILLDKEAILTCSVVANPSVHSVRWVKDNQLLSNAYNYTISAVTPGDSGTYTCIADNGVGKASQGNLELSVLYGPRVMLEKHKEVSVGDSVSIKCNVDSSPPPHSLLWLKEGDPLFQQSGDTLQLNEVDAEHSGNYVCQAINILKPAGSVIEKEMTSNASVTILIQHKPGNVEIVPQNPVAVAGKSFILTCLAQPSGWPLPEYHWWKEDKKGTDLERKVNYTIKSVHLSHEGRYHCQPQNVLGQGNIGSVYLTVQVPTSIIMPLRPQVIKQDGDATFSVTCKARGKPKPQVQWQKNGQEIMRENSLFYIETTEQIEDKNAYIVKSTLKFQGTGKQQKMISPEDRGRYSCEFENGLGEPIKSEMLLKIEHSPVVRHTYSVVAFDMGETAVLQCKMQAYPEPTFEWYFKGRKLENYGTYKTNVTDIGEDIYIGTLSILDVKDTDYGDYSCQARNRVGDDEKAFIKLAKKSPPDTPVNVSGIDVNSDRISLRWVEGFNGGFSNTEFLITYVNLKTGNTKNVSCHDQNPCQITGLQSKTDYKFKLRAVNPRGYSPYSDDIVVSTKVNMKDMPRATVAQYDRESHHVFFRVDPTVFNLVAKVEAKQSWENEWHLQKTIPVEHEEMEIYLDQSGEEFYDVRIVLCLLSNESWCGDEKLAEPYVDGVPQVLGTKPLLSTAVMVVIAAVAAGVFLLLVVIVICCCWKKRGKKANKKDYEMKGTDVQPKTISPPYYPDSNGGNKNVEGNMDDISKAPMYTTSIQSLNGHLLPSQHHANGMMYLPERDPSGNDSHSDLWMKSEGELPRESSYHTYDGGIPNGYYYPEDYQPLTEDVMNMKNREHLHSPYYDVSGLPNPYAINEDDKTQQISLSFDESLESGYSTPNSRNRRVVHEIIV